MPILASLAIGLVLSTLIGIAAYEGGSLSRSGVAGAILTGTLIFGLGGFIPGLLLVAFFVSSSFLSHFRKRAKEKFAETFEKGSRRDFGQALANGGWAAILALYLKLAENSHVEMLIFTAFVGTVAAVTADTWATEVGVLSTSSPRLITTGRFVPAGTSGGITPLGTCAALLGSAFIGINTLVGALTVLALRRYVPLGAEAIIVNLVSAPGAVGIFIVAIVSGMGGALFDSFLGATVQGIYVCEYDEVQTEKRIHTCGRATRLVRGWKWLDNDVVNFSASVIGSLVAFLLANLIFTNAVR